MDQGYLGDHPRIVGSRQACSLLLLTATLVGSCVALAVRTLLESGSAMLLVLLTVGFLASLMSVTLTVTRRHIRSRQEQGFTTAFFGCIRIPPLTRSSLAAPTPSAPGSADRGEHTARAYAAGAYPVLYSPPRSLG